MKKWMAAFYLFYFFAAASVFAVVLFPGEKVAHLLNSTIDESFDSLTFKADDVRLKPMLKMVVPNGEARIFDAIRLDVTDLTVSPLLTSIFRAQKDLKFNGRLKYGRFDGKMAGYKRLENRYESLTLALSGIEMENTVYQTQKFSFPVSMKGGAGLKYDAATRSAKGTLQCMNVIVEIPEDTMMGAAGIRTLRFDRVETGFEVKEAEILISNLTARGPDLSLDLKGFVIPGPGGGLQLSGIVRPDISIISKFGKMPVLNNKTKLSNPKGIALQISGTANNLVFRLK